MLNRLGPLLLLLSATLTFAAKPAPRAQELFISYWTSEPGWDTELQLKDNLTSQPLTVTPVLRFASGQEVPLTPVTIPANDSVSVWVNQGLLEHAPAMLSQPGSYGSVVFRYTAVSSMNLHATAIVSLHGGPIAFPIRANPPRQGAQKSPSNGASSLEGIWWQLHSGLNDVLVISNSSDKNVSGAILLFDANGTKWSEPTVLGPHQTERVAMSDLLQKAALTGIYGGISLQLPPAVVGAIHFMYDEADKFSASLEMFNHDPNATLREPPGKDAAQMTLRAPMLALRSPDPALGLPPGTVLHPTLLVRNTTNKRTAFNIVLDWHSPSGRGQATLPVMQLAPFATEQLPIGAMQEQLGIPDDAHWALVSLTTNAAPDDLIAVASSRDATGGHGVEAQFIGGTSGHLAGGEWPADANHNTIAAITNIGTKPADALLTLHYDGGKQKFELQRTLAPGDQMWVNLAQLIGQRIPDRTGSTLPVDVATVTYDLRDLTEGGHGLVASALAVNSTYGFQASPESAKCCPDESPGWSPDLFDLLIGQTDPAGIWATDSCNGDPVDITGFFGDWWSGNSAVATVASRQVHGVAAGSTYAYASGYVYVWNGSGCSTEPAQFQAPVKVFDVGVLGKSYILVGADPNVQRANQFQVTNSTQNGAPQPPGGTCCAASSDASDTVTQIEGPPNNLYDFQFQTLDQSATVGDRTLTFEYALTNGQATSVQQKVTARKFAYLVLTDNPPTNACSGYGTDQQYVYNVYTHPDLQPIQPQIAEGAAVNESFSPALTCSTITGNGSLDANAQVVDHISSGCSNTPLTCVQTSTQSISVGGYSVRTNTLQWTSNGVIYTNNGPNQ